MSCVVRWWDVFFVKGMHFSSKNARLLNYEIVSRMCLAHLDEIQSAADSAMD